jgi:hypothetical protein
LSGGDLAALFDLDMAEGEALAAVPPVAASAGSRRKSDKSAKAAASKRAKKKTKKAPSLRPSLREEPKSE